MLAILCLGAGRSAVSGVLGLVIFDILNGYTQAIPNVFVTTVIKCLLVGALFSIMKKSAAGNRKKEYTYAVICAAIYGITNIILDFAWSVAELVAIGNPLSSAIASELTSIPATIINAVFTVIGIALLYVPVVTAYRRIIRS